MAFLRSEVGIQPAVGTDPASDPPSTPPTVGVAPFTVPPVLAEASSDPRQLLAVSLDGSTSAMVNAWMGPGPLSVVTVAGTTTEYELGPTKTNGPGAAAFSPDGSWLAAIDGAGALWRIDLVDSSATQLLASAKGLVFGRWLRFEGNERLIVNLVGSVEVPLPTAIGAVDLSTMSVELLTTGGWERRGWPQADGGLIYASILPDGGAIQLMHRDPAGAVTPMANLGIATWLDVSPQGWAAYSNLSGAVLLTPPSGPTITLELGSIPHFSPDGSQVAIVSEAADKVLFFTVDGLLVGDVVGPFGAWTVCAEACTP